MFKHIKNNKGFSLIELLVVVAIIGILAAIAVPSYQGFQKNARIGVAKSALSNIYTLIRVAEAEVRDLDLTTHNLNLPDGYDALGIHENTAKSPIKADQTIGTLANVANCDYQGVNNWKAGANSSISNEEDVHITHAKEFGQAAAAGCNDDSNKTEEQCTGGSLKWIEASCPAK